MPSERWDATPDDNMQGSPELVIEVLSPSNTKREMQEKATLYLATGAQEFWIVDAKRENVTVVRREGSAVYEISQRIMLASFGGDRTGHLVTDTPLWRSSTRDICRYSPLSRKKTR
jgi:hypothetical protein